MPRQLCLIAKANYPPFQRILRKKHKFAFVLCPYRFVTPCGMFMPYSFNICPFVAKLEFRIVRRNLKTPTAIGQVRAFNFFDGPFFVRLAYIPEISY
jgi:hypothetical protein